MTRHGKLLCARARAAVGAAMLAATGAGLVDNLQAARQLWQLEQRFAPAVASDVREQWLTGWRAALNRALDH